MATLRRGEVPGPAWVMAAAPKIWGSRVAQWAAEVATPGGPVMLPCDGNGVARQHALAMAMWPQAGRGTAPLPPRAILHHLPEEPIS
eukprot:3741081-Alexandrium_andersonii.AAC.1